MMVVGIGHVRDYRAFSTRAKTAGGHVGAYVVQTGEAPGLIEKVTAPIGGSLYMLLDSRVKRIELHTVSGVPNHQPRKQVSPDEVRRRQHLSWQFLPHEDAIGRTASTPSVTDGMALSARHECALRAY
jgi:hypothetical protein